MQPKWERKKKAKAYLKQILSVLFLNFLAEQKYKQTLDISIALKMKN